MLLETRKPTSFLSLLIPPCLFQFHRKHKKNSILIQHAYNFVGKYLKVIEIFTTWTLVCDITQTLKHKIRFLEIRAQFLLGQGSGPRTIPLAAPLLFRLIVMFLSAHQVFPQNDAPRSFLKHCSYRSKTRVLCLYDLTVSHNI